ncbi:MAG: hypothetical protein NTX81_03020 [Candidatus Bathyarchaeota archaeon]|nr:hypothetical protein [Candidatus Bathyarchaeota archaeon]
MKFEATLNEQGFEIKALDIAPDEDQEKVVKSLLKYRSAFEQLSKRAR